MNSIKHYLIDFGAMLGSDSDMPKDARSGYEYMMPTGREALRGIFSLGLGRRPWETADYPNYPALGRFESKMFDPDQWKSNYPNPAFLSRRPDDEYWAAKQVMAFTDQDIRAIVATGEYTDPDVAETVSRILMARRNTIGRTYFEKVLPLDAFRVEAGELRFDDLAVRHGFAAPREYHFQWQRYDNAAALPERAPVGASARVPDVLRTASYFMVRIYAEGDPERSVSVYFRNMNGRIEVVGIDRTWTSKG
jgi:hypothetical protein